MQYFRESAPHIIHEQVVRLSGYQEVTRGKSEESLHVCNEACKQGIHSGIETQDRRHQRSKTVVSVAVQKITAIDRVQRSKIKKRETGATFWQEHNNQIIRHDVFCILLYT